MNSSESSQPQRSGPISLAGACVVREPESDATVCLAAAELARFLYLLTGTACPVDEAPPTEGTHVILNAAAGAETGASGSDPDGQGYRIRAFRSPASCGVRIDGESPVGVLYGVYRLLEELGMGFYAGGETYPDLPSVAHVAHGLDIHERPAFAVRGNLLHYNFLCGCTTWGINDYEFYFDQLARMRGNLLLMHWYDDEPGAAYEVDGEFLAGGATPSSLSKPWGAQAALRTSQFCFGTQRFFDEEVFSSPVAETAGDLHSEIKQTEAMFAEATAYAKAAGIRVAAGFEAPRGDPTDETTVARFKARVAQFLRRNPDLSYFALWQHESGGCVGSEPPSPGSSAAELLEQRRRAFAFLGNDQRVWEAIRLGRFAEFALEVLGEERPGLRLVVVGWGGDRWMRFADACLAYDELLPKSVIFTCHDNIDASYAPTVSEPWGRLPADRERWAMPWVENDLDDCQVRQPHVESLGTLAPDALRKGCQGLLTLQWRTRDVEEEFGYAAQFAWDPKLTPNGFYWRFARDCFGPDNQVRTSQHIAALQRLGARWTGVRGSVECGSMTWTGWSPHFPFEVDARAVAFLIDKTDPVIQSLAEVPRTADAEAAFHLIQGEESGGNAEYDETRPGVQEMKAVRRRLEALRETQDEGVLRGAFRDVEETVFELRPELVRFGMSSPSYRALDAFLITIHHLQRNAGAASHFETLERIRCDLRKLRGEWLDSGNRQRLERLDYLLATLDFAMSHDRAAMLLADGETIERALVKAHAARKQNRDRAARDTAAEGVRELVHSGLQQAAEAFGRKLTTRSDFGTLCTLNVKSFPLYWNTLGELESLMGVSPPRELRARRDPNGAVALSWSPRRCAAQNLYRKPLPDGDWTKINTKPMQAETVCFHDTTAPEGACKYRATALDEGGWECPMSHGVVVREISAPPRIVASKPPGRVRPGSAIPVRVVAVSDAAIRSVRLVFRRIGDSEWRRLALRCRFRDSYAGEIPSQTGSPRGVEYYVETVDAFGNQAVWPHTAPARCWTIVTYQIRRG